MANEVKIIIDVVDKASATLKKIQSELTKTGKDGAAGFTSMAGSALAAVGGITAVGYAVAKGAAFIQGAVNDWANYNEQIRKMSIATSAAPEDLSRLMQAADDVGVSMDSLYTSMRIMSKQGITPTIESMAQLSDKLLAIQDPTARAAEMARLFGRNWSEIAPFMLSGGEAIRQTTAAIDENLVSTEKSIQESRAYKEQIDILADRWTALKNQAAQIVLPIVVEGLEQANPAIDKVMGWLEKAAGYESAMLGLRSVVDGAGADIAKLINAQAAFAALMGDTTAIDRAREAIWNYYNALDVAGANYNPYIQATENAKVVTQEFGEQAEQTGQQVATSSSLLGYINEALSSYVENANLTKEAQDALGIATGRLTVTEIELRDKIQAVTEAMNRGLLTPQQWADAMALMADETVNASDKVSVLRSLIQSLKSKEITITVNYDYTGNFQAGAAGINVPGVSGNSGGGDNRGPVSNPNPKPPPKEPKGASGLDMVVPSGYPNDSYRIWASSGERAIIIPQNQQGGGSPGGALGNTIIYNSVVVNQQPGQSSAGIVDALLYQLNRRQSSRAAGIKYAGR